MRARFNVPTRSRAVRSALTLSLLAGPAILAGASLAPAEAAPGPRPSLELYVSSSEKDVTRPQGQSAWAHVPIWVTPKGGTFDLRVERPDYVSPVSVSQVVHESDGSENEVQLEGVVPQKWKGIKDFATVTVTNPKGVQTTSGSGAFCPNSWEVQRLDPAGSEKPSFPEWCFGSPLTLGTVWGLDDGWGTPILRRGGVELVGPVGDYTVTTTINPAYQDIFGIAPEEATATVTYHVANGPGEVECRGCRTHARTKTPQDGPNPRVPIDESPDPSTLPDLQALPSFAISTDHRGGKDYLAFASTVWVGGNAKMDIEGFRRQNEDVMDAYQYFYDGDEPVGRALVGELDFDTRRNHHHWHLQQFAQYRLLSADQEHVRLSKKQSFCLAATDAVNLALSGAAWRQTGEDLGSACGGDEAVWIRETLPLGWGDTYYQSRGGQDFNITDVPNGRYYVSVAANPTEELFETDKSNNVALREIRLKGQPGNRKVCVPAMGTLPQEGSCASVG